MRQSRFGDWSRTERQRNHQTALLITAQWRQSSSDGRVGVVSGLTRSPLQNRTTLRSVAHLVVLYTLRVGYTGRTMRRLRRPQSLLQRPPSVSNSLHVRRLAGDVSFAPRCRLAPWFPPADTARSCVRSLADAPKQILRHHERPKRNHRRHSDVHQPQVEQRQHRRQRH